MASSGAAGGSSTAASAAPSPGRCAQAECIASRHELELLKRDLDEIESENEQLHEQLGRKESECSALVLRLQQYEQDTGTKEIRHADQLTLKDAEIARLHSVVDELKVTMKAMATRPQQDSGSRGSDTDASTQAMDAVRAENESLATTVKELRAAIARETAASAHAKQEISKIQSDTKGKRDELYSALKENELLRQERQERDEALEKVSQLALDYEIALKVLHDQQKDYLEALDELRIDNAQQRTRNEQLEQEKRNVEAKLIEMDEHESHVDVIVKELKMKHDMEKAVLRAELDELRKKAIEWTQQTHSRVQSQLSSVPSSTGSVKPNGATGADLEELERQLELIHELRVRDQQKLEDKDEEIQQLRSDLESLIEHMQGGDADMENTVQQAVQAEAQKHHVIVKESHALKRRLKEQNELVEQLELRQAQLEKDLVDAQDWNAKYEANAGLEDVMKFQKKLRKELEKQQLANQKLRQELNDQRDATGKLHVAFERLKVEVGKEPDFEYDDLVIDNYLKGELAVQQSVMTQMEHQLHELENERVRLLQKLRDQARVVGGKLYEVHGLTTEQWSQVEEFMEQVKLTPEVAKRVLMNMETSASGSHKRAEVESAIASVSEREAEVKRLRKENQRLRANLEESMRREVVDDSRIDEASSRQNAASSTDVSTRNTATSPLKHAQDRNETSQAVENKDDVDAPRGENSRRRQRKSEPRDESDEEEGDRRDLRAQEDKHQRRGTEQSSPEVLAQAIAAALESRFAMLQSNISQGSSTSRSTHSVATQPSPVKGGAAMDNSLLAFETEGELALQVDFLREFQLLLDDYVQLEALNSSLQDQLAGQETACKALMDQQSVVYQHFFHLQDASTTEKSKLQYDMQQLKAQHHDLQLKCQRYEATLHTVQSSVARGEDETDAMRLRSEIVDLTRRLAHDDVAFAKLKREYALLQDEHRLSIEDAQHLEDDWLEMERVLKFRVLYLESWKSGAEDMLARMEATLDKCVLKATAERNQKDLESLLSKHAKLSEEYADLHARYLKLYQLPNHISKLQHENAMLVAERAARQGDAFVSVDAVAQSRVVQLQSELEGQLQRVKELQEKLHVSVLAQQQQQQQQSVVARDNNSEERIKSLESENAILYERISEVEQLYESLVREHTKAKQDAELAATQAHVLSRKITQEKAKITEKEDQLRDLMAATEDHSIVARLQQQLVHMKTNYQQFLLKYDQAVAGQQQATMLHQHSQLQMETQAKTESDAREKARAQLLVLETSVQEFKERDYVVRNTKWETFKKRLDGLEDEMRVEQDRRRALEKELEEKQAELPFSSGNTPAAHAAAAEINRLKSRIDTLETRERVLMGQLEGLTKSATAHTSRSASSGDEGLKKEIAELKRVHGEMLRQMQALQARNAELLQLTNELETQKRAVQREKDNLEMEYQQIHAQWQAHEGGSRGNNNQDGSSGSSPIMRKKVGLYEKDHVEQQQAAQASIASLKQLLTEKNAIIAEYQSKITSIRADVAAAKAHERADATSLHKKLYEENQKMIAQLREATEKIHHLEKTGSDKKALKAAQDRHEYVLQEWKRVEIELSAATSKLRELEMEINVLRNERDIAEARAGEALEEIVLNQEQIKGLEKGKSSAEEQLQFAKREMAKREEKMQVLREAIIKLKEEFLKAEDRHAIELAKSQNVVRHTKQSKSDNERDREQWQEEKEQLEAQVQMLQEKLSLAKKAEEKAKNEALKTSRVKAAMTKSKAKDAASPGDEGHDAGEQSASVLHAEVERLKNQLKERVVGEARIVEELEKKIKVLQAQNMALRESSVGPSAVVTSQTGSSKESRESLAAPRQQLQREQWESEKRLQRRVEVMTMRVKEKQLALERSEKDNEQLRQRLADAEAKLKELQRAASSAREAILGTNTIASTRPDASSAGPAGAPGSRKPVDTLELERQNTFLQETLVLKRKEWEDAFQAQMEKYETQLHRLRSRLAQRSTGRDQDLSALEQEERDFVATHDVRDEMLALGDELREKERQLVEKDTRSMELELELESLRAEYQRLHRKAATAGTATTQQSSRPSTATTRRTKTSSQERLELEEVIENMKKVIEKLRSENEKLRKATATIMAPDKVEAMRRKLKETRDARQELQLEVDHLRNENAELKKDKLRLQQRVRMLTSSSASPSRQPTADSDKEKLQLEAQLQQQTAMITELQDRIGQKDAYVRELNQQLAKAPVPANEAKANAVEELQQQVDALSHENEELRHELSAFDQDFFEEIEDLKYKYAQAIRDKQQLELALRRDARDY